MKFLISNFILLSFLILSYTANAVEKNPTKNTAENSDFLLTTEKYLRLNQLQKRSYIKALQDFMVRGDFSNIPELKTSLMNLLIENAFAAIKEGDDCIFAGYMKKLVISGISKKLVCEQPNHGNCKKGQVQCNPLLFGKDICISPPFKMATKNCQLESSLTDIVLINFNTSQSQDFYSSLVSEINDYCRSPLDFNKDNCNQLKVQIKEIDIRYQQSKNPLNQPATK